MPANQHSPQQAAAVAVFEGLEAGVCLVSAEWEGDMWCSVCDPYQTAAHIEKQLMQLPDERLHGTPILVR